MNQHHAERTPAGTSYHRGDGELGDLPQRVRPDPDGRYTVDVHVTPDGHARIGDRLYTPEEFADVLRRNGDYDGRPIRLIGCDAGSNDFARRLSTELDTEVLAPSKPAWTDSRGRVFSSDYEVGPDGRMRPRIPPNGEWEVHRPDGSASRAGDDGFTPDTADADKRDVDGADAQARGREFPSPQEHDWREPSYTPPARPVTVAPGERFFDPANPRQLDPETKYEVTDGTGRRTTVYTDDSRPPNITHVDAEVPNVRVGSDPHQPVGNPDTDHLLPGVDYRVDTGEGVFEFRTGPDGRPVLDLDDFDPPSDPPPRRMPPVEGWDPSARGDGPFSNRPREELQPNARYDVYSTGADGGRVWHGTFYTDSDVPPKFTHIETWPDHERGRVNPETGDRTTMHDRHDGRPDGLPLPGVKYKIGDMVYHADPHGNAAVSFEPDYSSPAGRRVDTSVQRRVGHIGQADHPQAGAFRGGHTADHAAGGGQGRLAMFPQPYRQNHLVGNPDNWAQMETDRRTIERHGADNGRVRVWNDAPSVGETPDRTHVLSERRAPDGSVTHNYRSFVNVPNPAPPVRPSDGDS